MYDPLPSEPCSYCHEPAASVLQESKAVSEHFEETRALLLEETEALGLTGEKKFDYLVDRLQRLPSHRVAGEEGDLKPEFAELFRRFRIGKIHFSYTGPDGEPAVARVIRCSDCHAAEPMLADSPVGLETSAELARRSRELSATIATAERILLNARRGGVETRAVLVELESALDAQIGLGVLGHTFSTAGPFAERYQEGLGHAEAALAHAREALDELAYRRRGLAVALVFVALLLVALVLKIRQLDAS